MSGSVTNNFSEQVLGLIANVPVKPSDSAAYGQFKATLQQSSSLDVAPEPLQLTGNFGKELAQIQQHSNDKIGTSSGKSGKNLPMELIFSQQSLSELTEIADLEQATLDADLIPESSLTLESNGVDLDGTFSAAVKQEPEFIPGLDWEIPVGPQALLNREINLTTDPTVTDKSASADKLLVQTDKTPAETLVTPSVFLSTSEIESETLVAGKNITNKDSTAVIPATSVAKLSTMQANKTSTTEGFHLSNEKEQAVATAVSQSADKKSPDWLKNGVSAEDEILSEKTKPELSKLSGTSSKQIRAEYLSKNDISPMADWLKKSGQAAKGLSVTNNVSYQQPASELESLLAVSKTPLAANHELSVNSVRPPINVMANSAIQSGLKLQGDFSANLALRVQWVYQQAISSAEILMDPPELGPLSVKLTTNNGETSVLFQVSNPATKEMIEENLAKLKEMLAEQGINLGDAQVEQQQQNDQQENIAGQKSQETSSDSEDPNEQEQIQVRLLDTYI